MMISLGTLLSFWLTITLLAICIPNCLTLEDGLNSMVYLSPKITQHPGSIWKQKYFDMEFPKGHIALKSFNAEVVDEAGNPIPLHETYLHHWIAQRYYEKQSDFIIAGNAGICDRLPQFFGLGSETRKTSTHVPDPYGIEVGNPLKVPAGYEEKWMFEIHAIDTRGAVDAKGCTECRCDLYNVKEDEYGEPLEPSYLGGIHCCYNGTQCKVKDGVESVERNIYLKYTVKWVDWSDFIIPVQIIIIDVTDSWQYTGIHNCLIEYNIEKSITGVPANNFTNTIDGVVYGEIGSALYGEIDCDIKRSTMEVAANDFTSTKRSSVNLPIDGDVIYAVAHQHSGGIGSTLYSEDGRIICASKPIYGQGKSAGDEAGYIVGMSTCYPKPGSVKIAKGESVTIESKYNNEKSHTGVMGHFYILVADSTFKSNEPVEIDEEYSNIPIFLWGVAVFGLATCAAVLVAYKKGKQNEDGYLFIAP